MLSRLSDLFCSTGLVIEPFYVKYCSVLPQYYKINLLIGINFLSKKNMFLDPFFMQFYATKKF